MKNKKKQHFTGKRWIAALVVVVLILAAIYYYIALPTINIVRSSKDNIYRKSETSC